MLSPGLKSGYSLPSDNSFLEVSGISAEVKNKPYKEGGENRFTHQLPEGVEYTNLILKRGIASMSSPLVLWCRQIIEGGFVMPILTQELTVSLMDSSGAPARSWSFVNARPVKWEVEGFNTSWASGPANVLFLYIESGKKNEVNDENI